MTRQAYHIALALSGRFCYNATMLQNSFVASLLAVLVVSLVSLIGLVVLGLKQKTLQNVILYLISFAAGTLMGDVFLHLLPEIIESADWSITTSLAILSGIVLSLILEKVIHWQHCHLPVTSHHQHRFAWMNLFGDGIHNFIDGIVIAASFMVSLPTGIATTVAVFVHEIPQEIGDFGVLVHSGFSRKKALLFNFLTALTAVVGVLLAWQFTSVVNGLEKVLLPFAAGSFLYIAGSDLIPELHKEPGLKQAIGQVLSFMMGIAIMSALLFLE